LNAGEDGRHIISWTPAVLQDVETELAGSVNVRVEHLADELDGRRFVRILLLKMHNKSERSVFEGGVSGANNDSVPRDWSDAEPKERETWFRTRS